MEIDLVITQEDDIYSVEGLDSFEAYDLIDLLTEGANVEDACGEIGIDVVEICEDEDEDFE